jgi:DNA modification methylase
MLKKIKLKDLVPFDRNPRKNKEAIDRVLESLKSNGYISPIVVCEIDHPFKQHVIAAGHTRFEALKKFGAKEVNCFVHKFDSEAQFVRYNIEDNKTAEFAEWDEEVLNSLSAEFNIDIGEMGFEFEGMDDPIEGLTDEDEVPEPPAEPVAKFGQMWRLGDHRLMCGDSTDREQVEKLMGGEKAQLLHADPPYGMGKEGDGVANDNLYRDKLDKFQMQWWSAFRQSIDDNASAYIWGNAPELWRLWYSGGMNESERMTIRNEIVWDKGHGQGMSAEEFRSFPIATERALFFMLGEQGFNNNADNYWDGWDSIIEYLEGERSKAGYSIKDCKRLAGHSEKSGCHWFDKSQWMMPTEAVYNSWRDDGKAFKREYDDLKREYDDLKREYDDLKREFYSTRAYFDNAHDNMTDVWNYKRVKGEERHGHATPKPVEMMERVMLSSLPKGGLCVEPFGGSGSTLMGAEKTGRRCYTVELQPQYCDVIIKRWQDFTGKKAELI